MVTPEQVKQYREEGYVKAEGLFSPAETQELGSELIRIISEWGQETIGWHGPWREAYLKEEEQQTTKAVFLHNPLRALCGALGYSHSIDFHENREDAMAAVEEHHEAGSPVILQFGAEFPLVYPGLRVRLLGHETHMTRAEVQASMADTEGFLELGLYGYYVFTIGERDREPKPEQVYRGALRRARKIARAERRVRGCAVGLLAYDSMIAVLRA